jgi:DNA modification methylase
MSSPLKTPCDNWLDDVVSTVSVAPYYRDEAVVIFNADCKEIVPQMPKSCLLLTDPPYGIKQDRGMGGGGYDGFGEGVKRNPRAYEGGWDNGRPEPETLQACLAAADVCIVWGGNYFSDLLPQACKWLVWDKEQTMPSYSDAELAWTTLSGVSVKMLRYCGAGLMAKEKGRQHPTQKPLSLMTWCIGLAGDVQTILDPFAGSCTTGRAAKDLGRKAVLIEREERYCEIGAKRMAQEVLAL